MPPRPPASTPRLLAKFGFGPQLRRRADGEHRLDYAIGAFVGVISGAYMFNEPIKEYFEERREEAAAAKSNSKPEPQN
ncbi:hypothetical protein TrCOL_g13697 [Triparma columacea]|uniref:Uncharacterized protein n=1 Tax=Triparma columacea TaxID=722753 RepID=A0A9W7GK24_9STRA|nr:hypothetical protein TrCOL_g13697 [Triparma columacea]